MEKETLGFSLRAPNSVRKHVVVVGETNSGKSMLVNVICGQEVSLVSEIEGTTTDAVFKAMELKNVGPVVFIDTAGFGDNSVLGKKRIDKTLKALEKADIILYLVDRKSKENSESTYIKLKEYSVPIIPVINKCDIGDLDFDLSFIDSAIEISAIRKINIDKLINSIIDNLKNEDEFITRNLVKKGDNVILVMPQDIQAPKSRLILPQVQTIRELLDRKVKVFCTTTDMLDSMLQSINNIDLVITDSQAFKEVNEILDKSIRLTSFSILFAAYKGDIDYFIKSTNKIDSLNENSKVLIAEACTHAPMEEDIGRVKIPMLLKRKYGNLAIDFVRGGDFGENLKNYDLIIHCGACMFNKQHVVNRVNQCKSLGIAITNYGICIAKLNGMLERIEI